MHSQGQTPAPLFRVISFVAIAAFIVAAIPVFAQYSVPPTAVQAAKMPQFASRLAHPARRVTPPKSQVFAKATKRRGPLDSNDIYDNGPINGNTDAWTIDFGFITSDSFNLASDGTNITGMSFGAWLFSGDTAPSVEVSITSLENGGTSYFDQTVNFTESNCASDQYGYNVCTETASFAGPKLNAGTYWVNLQNASVPSGDPVYWDENSGVGCQGQGCPSQASQNDVGSIPSESFTILGEASTTTSTCFYCLPVCQGPASIHDFTGGEDGNSPNGVISDQAGNLYGSTQLGGNGSVGAIFKLIQAGSGWILNSLYSFAGGTDGSYPTMPIIGPHGNLYGTARGGLQSCGNQSCSAAYSLSPQPTACLTANCNWNKSILYEFDTIDGVSAHDAEGNLYGTDYSGGVYGLGAVFELTPSLGYWTKTILYSFTGGQDGNNPGAVLLGEDGNLYGRASGGAHGYGVVFQLVRSQGWAENTIYAVLEPDYGFQIFFDLVQDGSGFFYFAVAHYRTDNYGWYVDGIVNKLAYANGQWSVTQVADVDPGTWNAGVNLYQLAADTNGFYTAANAWVYDCFQGPCPVLLYNKISTYQGAWLDVGQYFTPYGPMLSDSQGNVYGATPGCGEYGYGAVWRWDTRGELPRRAQYSP